MVRLRLLDEDPVLVHQIHRLEELDIVDETYELVLAAAEEAPEVNNTDAGVNELDEEGDDSRSHQPLADISMLRLKALKLLDVQRFFLDVARLIGIIRVRIFSILFLLDIPASGVTIAVATFIYLTEL